MLDSSVSYNHLVTCVFARIVSLCYLKMNLLSIAMFSSYSSLFNHLTPHQILKLEWKMYRFEWQVSIEKTCPSSRISRRVELFSSSWWPGSSHSFQNLCSFCTIRY